MIGAAYWSRAIAGLVGTRVVVKGRRPIHTATGKLIELGKDTLTLVLTDGSEREILYGAIQSVECPPPGEDGRA